MKKVLNIVLLSIFSLTVISCASSDDSAATSSDNTTTVTTTSTTAIFGTSLFDSSYFGD